MLRKIAIYGLFCLIILSIVGVAVIRLTQSPKNKPLVMGSQTFRGPVVKTIYSSLQVEVVVRNKHIIDVIPLVLPNSDARSIALARVSVPILRLEAISQNSAKIHAVSGASVTSSAYMRSLQGALAQAGL